jgi:hypothetical protein
MRVRLALALIAATFWAVVVVKFLARLEYQILGTHEDELKVLLAFVSEPH